MGRVLSQGTADDQICITLQPIGGADGKGPKPGEKVTDSSLGWWGGRRRGAGPGDGASDDL